MEKEIVLAGGCFWGTEHFFKQFPGILNTEVGYANGQGSCPSYQQVCSGVGDFAEAVKITYDPEKIHLAQILYEYFQIIDPFSVNKQGNDIGRQYRTGIYYENAGDKKVIDAIIAFAVKQAGRELAVEVLPLKNFYPAEDYHQDYLVKNPGGYCHIPRRLMSGQPLVSYELLKREIPGIA